jgi:glycerophosphoryl diester phosphodiesterase
VTIELHGHRGARGLWPENSLPGFAAAIALGVTAIEMDVALTADGVVALSHDPWLDPDLTRLAGAWLESPTPCVLDLTFAELSRYDIGRIRPGSAQADRFPDQRGLDGLHIPTLAEVVALRPEVMLSVEIKTYPDRPTESASPEAMADAVLAVLEEGGALDRTRVISFDWRGLRHLRRRRPGLSLGFLTDAESLADAALWWDGPSPADYGGSIPRAIAAEAAAGAITAWGPDYGGLSEPQVAEAKALGLLVNPWTVNEQAAMTRLLGWGVGAITTDYPDRGLRAIAAFSATCPRREVNERQARSLIGMKSRAVSPV